MQNDHFPQKHPRGSSPSQEIAEIRNTGLFISLVPDQRTERIASLLGTGLTINGKRDDVGNWRDLGGEGG